ncbi:GNAT family N-acetyltransferase [Streptomyces oceani]|uniref:Acetyltransferase n=1 Tax=Streptomyces oceani TaxID=1075402 RepID=A0A1E7KGJ6_9ACTN|nr:GNAT family N-acetyltransferase [Streptomyces oceani]OEV03035.1 acetyltransferase [Streptomyces oceani]
MEPNTLRTERLLLRPFEPRDVPAVHTSCQDPEILRWTTLPEPYTKDLAEEFVGVTSPASWRTDTAYNFGVFTREGTLVGSMGLVSLGLQAPQRQAEIGFWTRREQRGKGYTVEAGRAVLDWAFDELGVERLEWVAAVGNEASRAVALRLGFVMEGRQRARITHRGTRQDAWVAALLPSDCGKRSATPYVPEP